MAEILAAHNWPTNAALIADVARLGYIKEDSFTLDPTYGRGLWWTEFRPANLITHNHKSDGVDFRHLPYEDNTFDVVAYDPPYKLNGTPTPEVDARYGVDEPTRWLDRMDLITAGQDECLRVLRPGGHLLMKCQDQVCSGQVRWQTLTACYRTIFDCALVDAFLMLGHRPQPSGRSQVHARRNYSTLLVFQKRAG